MIIPINKKINPETNIDKLFLINSVNQKTINEIPITKKYSPKITFVFIPLRRLTNTHFCYSHSCLDKGVKLFRISHF